MNTTVDINQLRIPKLKENSKVRGKIAYVDKTELSRKIQDSDAMVSLGSVQYFDSRDSELVRDSNSQLSSKVTQGSNSAIDTLDRMKKIAATRRAALETKPLRLVEQKHELCDRLKKLQFKQEETKRNLWFMTEEDKRKLKSIHEEERRKLKQQIEMVEAKVAESDKVLNSSMYVYSKVSSPAHDSVTMTKDVCKQPKGCKSVPRTLQTYSVQSRLQRSDQTIETKPEFKPSLCYASEKSEYCHGSQYTSEESRHSVSLDNTTEESGLRASVNITLSQDGSLCTYKEPVCSPSPLCTPEVSVCSPSPLCAPEESMRSPSPLCAPEVSVCSYTTEEFRCSSGSTRIRGTQVKCQSYSATWDSSYKET